MSDLLLLSGGIDSSCLAGWLRPKHVLTLDYGQLPAAAEIAASRSVARELGIRADVLRIDCHAIGTGILAGGAVSDIAPSPEWWPFRNQLLVTLAAPWALQRGFSRILVGSVAGDGARHADGRRDFYAVLNELLQLQEGTLAVEAPALDLTTAELVRQSGVSRAVLGWSHSCHRADLACGGCPGCTKRSDLYQELGWS